MLTFDELVQDVGTWSLANFEQSWTDLPVRYTDPHNEGSPVQVGLGSLAPLLGIGEEIGELNEAEDTASMLDAVGDILIYMADWCYREKLTFPVVEYSAEEIEGMHERRVLSSAYGQMCHAKLKRCQKIRGMDDDIAYQGAMDKAMTSLMCALKVLVDEELSFNDKDEGKNDLLGIANDTWKNVVSKRNWKAWRKAGVEGD